MSVETERDSSVRVLFISVSPRKERSGSDRMAKIFLDEYLRLNPTHTIVHRPLFETDLPEFGEKLCQAKFSPLYGEEMTESERREWERVLALIEEFASFDKVVLATPMWNFSIPYKLKHYFDILVQPFVTFGYDPERMAHFGLLKDRPVQLVITRSSVQIGDPSDFQLPYLRTIFDFIGITDLRIVAATETTRPSAADRDQYLQNFTPQLLEAAQKF